MPSLSASVAAFDPSPPYLRCKHCQGKLLRGLQSLICIYCGQKLHQNADVAPDPIFFKSTVGYNGCSKPFALMDRAVDTPNKVGDDAVHASENADIRGESNPSKNNMDIEGIMSQMHDLSFMLETNLSIPSKSNNSLPRD